MAICTASTGSTATLVTHNRTTSSRGQRILAPAWSFRIAASILLIIAAAHGFGQADSTITAPKAARSSALTAMDSQIPNNELLMAFGVTFMPQATTFDRFGPHQEVGIPMRAYPHFQARYVRRVNSTWGLSVAVGLAASPTSYRIPLPDVHDSMGNLIWSAKEHVLYGHWLDRVEFSLMYLHTMTMVGRRFIEVGLGPRLTVAYQGDVSLLATEEGVADHAYLTTIGTYARSPIAGIAAMFSYGWVGKRFGRWNLEVDGLWMPSLLFEGSYRIASGTIHESGGYFSQSGTYIGLNVSHAFTWGPPKEPRWKSRP